jgi:hypothetical protein
MHGNVALDHVGDMPLRVRVDARYRRAASPARSRRKHVLKLVPGTYFPE